MSAASNFFREKVACKFFCKTGKCDYGNNCRFEHPCKTGERPPKHSCKSGAGSNGKGLKGGKPSGTTKSNNSSNNNNRSSSSSSGCSSSSSSQSVPSGAKPENIMSPDLDQFRKTVFANFAVTSQAPKSKKGPGCGGSSKASVSQFHQVVDSSRGAEDHWRPLWSAASRGVLRPWVGEDANAMLVAMLLELPDSQKYMPVVTDVLQVLLLVVRFAVGGSTGTGAKSGKDPVERGIVALESVQDAVHNRLTIRLREGTAELGDDNATAARLAETLAMQFENAAERLKSACEGVDRLPLKQRARDLIAQVGKLEVFVDIVRTSHSHQHAGSAVTGVAGVEDGGSDTWTLTDPEQSWSGWQRPTVGWLMTVDWLDVSELRSKYDSVAAYVLQLRQLWTMLTFYWGSAALWPRCVTSTGGKGGDAKPCGTPLMTRAGGRDLMCTMKLANGSRCRRPATWRCYKGGEKIPHCATCDECLRLRRDALAGRRTHQSSTDVYDATVEREDVREPSGAVVYKLKNVSSRRPPTVPPNWRTSYRLTTSALVAVVALPCRDDRLRNEAVIQWGEIVDYNSGPNARKYEAEHRANGCVAVRLLNRGDCAALHAESDKPLEVGVHVAVIDFQVFVPEVISVMNTFTSESFLPNLQDIPFMDALIGRAHRARDAEFHHDENKGAAENIRAAIASSEVEVVRRLTEEQRTNIATRILELGVVKSLYGAQLEAFTDALAHSAHCTQGPPGTGKVSQLVEHVYSLWCYIL